MVGAAPIVAFVPARDLERARDFYELVLGLTVVRGDPYGCELRGGGTTLRIAWVEEYRPQPFTVLGWSVTDIAATLDELLACGVTAECFDGMDHDRRGVWTAPSGDRVAWFKDPDGNTLSLTQAATAE